MARRRESLLASCRAAPRSTTADFCRCTLQTHPAGRRPFCLRNFHFYGSAVNVSRLLDSSTVREVQTKDNGQNELGTFTSPAATDAIHEWRFTRQRTRDIWCRAERNSVGLFTCATHCILFEWLAAGFSFYIFYQSVIDVVVVVVERDAAEKVTNSSAHSRQMQTFRLLKYRRTEKKGVASLGFPPSARNIRDVKVVACLPVCHIACCPFTIKKFLGTATTAAKANQTFHKNVVVLFFAAGWTLHEWVCNDTVCANIELLLDWIPCVFGLVE